MAVITNATVMERKSVMDRLSELLRLEQPSKAYEPPVVGRLTFKEVGNISIEALRKEQIFASHHTGSPCPCKC